MNIPAKVTDEVFLEMIHEQLGRSSAKCGHKCCSVDELLGRMTKEQNVSANGLAEINSNEQG